MKGGILESAERREAKHAAVIIALQRELADAILERDAYIRQCESYRQELCELRVERMLARGE